MADPVSTDEGLSGRAKRRRTMIIVGTILAIIGIVWWISRSRYNDSVASSSSQSSSNAVQGTIDVSTLAAGAAPAIGYADHGTVHLADGSVVKAPGRGALTGFTELTGGTMVYLTQQQHTSSVEVVEKGGKHFGPYPTASVLAVNTGHTLAAWLAPDGTPTTWQNGLKKPISLPQPIPGSNLRMAAVTGTSCSHGATCRVFATSWKDTTPSGWVVSSTGGLSHADPQKRLITIRDATDTGQLVGYTVVRTNGTCSGLVDEGASGKPQVFQTCNHTLDSFSPNGSYVSGGPDVNSGPGQRGVAIYDASGGELVRQDLAHNDAGFLQTKQWEDNSHVLFPLFQNDTWSVVRLAVDGTMQTAVKPVSGTSDQTPFVLETTP